MDVDLMAYEVSVFMNTHDMSDPLSRFWQVGIRVCRDDGKSFVWRGQPIDQPEKYPEMKIPEAIASAVREMLKDRTVLEFVGHV